MAFEHAGLDWREHVEIDPRYYRPAEVDRLLADPAKARRELGWQHQTGIAELVKIMVDADIEDLRARRAGELKPALTAWAS
jgi:GDPmannose 4,6-dehydratase